MRIRKEKTIEMEQEKYVDLRPSTNSPKICANYLRFSFLGLQGIDLLIAHQDFGLQLFWFLLHTQNDGVIFVLNGNEIHL